MPQPWVLLAIVILSLQSCGGGNGDMGPPEPTHPPEARAKGLQA